MYINFLFALFNPTLRIHLGKTMRLLNVCVCALEYLHWKYVDFWVGGEVDRAGLAPQNNTFWHYVQIRIFNIISPL